MAAVAHGYKQAADGHCDYQQANNLAGSGGTGKAG
jgi:hypothetical protein